MTCQIWQLGTLMYKKDNYVTVLRWSKIAISISFTPWHRRRGLHHWRVIGEHQVKHIIVPCRLVVYVDEAMFYGEINERLLDFSVSRPLFTGFFSQLILGQLKPARIMCFPFLQFVTCLSDAPSLAMSLRLRWGILRQLAQKLAISYYRREILMLMIKTNFSSYFIICINTVSRLSVKKNREGLREKL